MVLLSLCRTQRVSLKNVPSLCKHGLHKEINISQGERSTEGTYTCSSDTEKYLWFCSWTYVGNCRENESPEQHFEFQDPYAICTESYMLVALGRIGWKASGVCGGCGVGKENNPGNPPASQCVTNKWPEQWHVQEQQLHYSLTPLQPAGWTAGTCLCSCILLSLLLLLLLLSTLITITIATLTFTAH